MKKALALVLLISVLFSVVGIYGSAPLFETLILNIEFLLFPLGLLFLVASFYAFKQKKKGLWQKELSISTFFTGLAALTFLFSFFSMDSNSGQVFLRLFVKLAYLFVFAVFCGFFAYKAKKINPNTRYHKTLWVLCLFSIVGIPVALVLAYFSVFAFTPTCYAPMMPPSRVPPEFIGGSLISLKRDKLVKKFEEKGVFKRK